ncbi:class IV lanthionine synthetase LanL [Streptomyces sp. NPDC002659]|uniref:class IV lanthionine synthetase LanL n=1 Tax=Streptomyces sp. NPDC002659 TaxID=3364656 RepID=UPI0036B221A5
MAIEDLHGSGDARLDNLFRAIAGSAIAEYAASGIWKIIPGEFWCQVEKVPQPRRLQGWKLHVSATPLSAPHVLARAAEILIRRDCPFKFAGTVEMVADLVSARQTPGRAGKFITAYPINDIQAVAIAEEIHRATIGLPGPRILSDQPFRAGSLVHYRFGAFTGIPMLGNDGTYDAMLAGPDGAPVLDQRNAWPTTPSWAPPDPFTKNHAAPLTEETPPRAVRLNERFAVQEAIRHAYRGGVFRATDEQTGATVIVKQARPHTGADLTGRDARDALRHEASMLELLQSCALTPSPVDLFEEQGDLFLVQEELPGATLRRWVRTRLGASDGHLWGLAPTLARNTALQLVGLVETVHAQGLVIRDFNPSNILVTGNDDLRLIDLELLSWPGELVANALTAGYAAPEQANAPRLCPAPGPSSDLFSLGATLFYLASGADPRLPDDSAPARLRLERIAGWLDHVSADNAAARFLAPAIIRLMHPDPDRRPALDDVRRLFASPQPHKGSSPPPQPARDHTADLERAITDGLSHLTATMTPDHPERLWPTAISRADPLAVDHGAAGVLAVMAHALQVRPDERGLREAVQAVTGWLKGRAEPGPRLTPGLGCGRSGTAWALLDAARVLDDDVLEDFAVGLARRIPLDWPDPSVRHGVAGAGLTQLHFWETTADDRFLARARRAADTLAARAVRQEGCILWPVPQSFASARAGTASYGYADGVAGIGAFLLAIALATGNERYLELARTAATTIRRIEGTSQGTTSLPRDNSGGPRPTSGQTSDASLFLLRMWCQEPDDQLLGLLTLTADRIRRRRRAASTLPPGLSDDGEFLLDLAQTIPHTPYRTWAHDLATALHPQHALHNGRVITPAGPDSRIPADHTGGLSGYLNFALRLRHGGPRLWLPLPPTA